MASFKLNFAHIGGCPAPAVVAKALQAFGLPESEEFGVLSHQAADTAVFATIIRRTQQAMPRLDPESKELTAAPVERDHALLAEGERIHFELGHVRPFGAAVDAEMPGQRDEGPEAAQQLAVRHDPAMAARPARQDVVRRGFLE